MTTTVTVSKFRENLSEYLEFLTKEGNKVKITDGRKGRVLTTLTKVKEKEFNWDEHAKFIESLGGSGFLAGKKNEDVRRKFREDINKRFEEARKR